MRRWESYLVDLGVNSGAAQSANLPAGLKQAGRTWLISAAGIQSLCAAGKEAREQILISNIITFGPTASTHTWTQTQIRRPPW